MNLKLEINYIASDVFQDKLSMMISTGDAFDLLCLMEDQKSLPPLCGDGRPASHR